MARCTEGAKPYRVAFEYVESDGTVLPGDYLADIGPHGDAPDAPGPRTSQSAPYEGPLCVHEVAWLAAPPGKQYSYHRRYTVTPRNAAKGD